MFRDYSRQMRTPRNNSDSRPSLLAHAARPIRRRRSNPDRLSAHTRRSTRGADDEFIASTPTLRQSLKRTAAKHRTTLVVLLSAALKTLLHRLSNQTDLVLGMPVAGQAVTDRPCLVGQCVNLLPADRTWIPTPASRTRSPRFIATCSMRSIITTSRWARLFNTSRCRAAPAGHRWSK